MKKLLIVGAGGQLGWELQRIEQNDYELICLPRAQLDITNVDVLKDVFDRIQPAVVVNAAAYTAVDKAEEDRESAFLVNETGVRNLARLCRESNTYLVHISTDFVFGGNASTPYGVDAETAPLGVYGASKLAGEIALQEEMPNNWAIIRTAWVYSAHGGNFVKSMLRLMSSKPELGIVADQVGTPTWAKGLAQRCFDVAKNQLQGVFHWTDSGVTSWYDFAVAIQELAIELELLDTGIKLKPIPASAYPTPAVRPSYSVLDKSKIYQQITGLEYRHWRSNLNDMLKELTDSGE